MPPSSLALLDCGLSLEDVVDMHSEMSWTPQELYLFHARFTNQGEQQDRRETGKDLAGRNLQGLPGKASGALSPLPPACIRRVR